MRKFLLVVLAVVLMTVFLGCAVTEYAIQEYKKSGPLMIFNVQERYYDDIENSFTVYSQKIYRNYYLSVHINKVDYFTSTMENYYFISVGYNDGSHRFLSGEIKIQIDNGEIFSIRDSDPDRIIYPYKHVHEIIKATIDKEKLIEMSNASSIRMQFFGKPINISKKGIEFIHLFMVHY